ncbi:MAG: hypothetical protein ACRENE_29080, partial [Polyangiaceae bacterium]
IWRTIEREGTRATLFGLGTGATYVLFERSTSGNTIPDYHNSHFTPVGWVLRGGVVGLAVNASFYAALALSSIMSISGRHRSNRAYWQPAFTTYGILAICVCTTSFSLTPSPATHIICLAVLLRSAKRAET